MLVLSVCTDYTTRKANGMISVVSNMNQNLSSWSKLIFDQGKQNLAQVSREFELTKFKDVRTNCFCASLLRTQIHATSCMSAHALSNNMNNDRADGHCYSFA